MGIYYYALDESEKKKILPPKHYADTPVGIFHPKNPFPGMIIMKNLQGYNFKITNNLTDFHDKDEYEDITEQVYEEYKDFLNDCDWGEYNYNTGAGFPPSAKAQGFHPVNTMKKLNEIEKNLNVHDDELKEYLTKQILFDFFCDSHKKFYFRDPKEVSMKEVRDFISEWLSE